MPHSSGWKTGNRTGRFLRQLIHGTRRGKLETRNQKLEIGERDLSSQTAERKRSLSASRRIRRSECGGKSRHARCDTEEPSGMHKTQMTSGSRRTENRKTRNSKAETRIGEGIV